jgi:hypothetical protein
MEYYGLFDLEFVMRPKPLLPDAAYRYSIMNGRISTLLCPECDKEVSIPSMNCDGGKSVLMECPNGHKFTVILVGDYRR